MSIFYFSKSVYYHCLKPTRVYNHEVILESLDCNFCFILKSFFLIMQCLFEKPLLCYNLQNCIMKIFFIKPITSFINILNSNGRRVDPCGTLTNSFLKVLCMLTNKITRSLNIFFYQEMKRCYLFSFTIYSAFTFT